MPTIASSEMPLVFCAFEEGANFGSLAHGRNPILDREDGQGIARINLGKQPQERITPTQVSASKAGASPRTPRASYRL